ncbi:SDR family NAD(P)-dependent oxidoreductase, partial [Clostridium perfringens]
SSLDYHVCLLGRTKSKLEQTAKFLTNSYSIYEVDVTSKQMVSQIIQSIQDDFGSIHLLINNAGVGFFDYAAPNPLPAPVITTIFLLIFIILSYRE